MLICTFVQTYISERKVNIKQLNSSSNVNRKSEEEKLFRSALSAFFLIFTYLFHFSSLFLLLSPLDRSEKFEKNRENRLIDR